VRTTVTLTPEAAALVDQAMREGRKSFTAVVNEAIVASLSPKQPVVVELPTHRMGVPRVNLDKATQLAGELEDLEIIRKMSLGK
jgi:hypothetical protein